MAIVSAQRRPSTRTGIPWLGQYGGKVCLGIESIHAHRADQAKRRNRVLATSVDAGEQVVPPPVPRHHAALV
jgi:hypothetical protein